MPVFPVLRGLLAARTAVGLVARGGDPGGTVAKVWGSVGWQTRRFEIVPE